MKDGAGMLWVDVNLAPAGEAHVDPRDRGYALGDGLFETMRAREGRLPWLECHLARLRAGAEVVGLSGIPHDGVLAGAIYETLEANGLSEAVVRLTVSRGVPARRGLLPEPGTTPTLVIAAQPFVGYPPSLYERGMRAITSRIPRNERSPLARIKALSYLENVLARREADARARTRRSCSTRPDAWRAPVPPTSFSRSTARFLRRTRDRGFCLAPCGSSCWTNSLREWG